MLPFKTLPLLAALAAAPAFAAEPAPTAVKPPPPTAAPKPGAQSDYVQGCPRASGTMMGGPGTYGTMMGGQGYMHGPAAGGPAGASGMGPGMMQGYANTHCPYGKAAPKTAPTTPK